MKIEGRKGTYICKWYGYGWSYARAYIQVPRRWLWNKTVWYGSTQPRLIAEKMHPSQLRDWFTKEVQRYEDYVDAWDKYK